MSNQSKDRVPWIECSGMRASDSPLTYIRAKVRHKYKGTNEIEVYDIRVLRYPECYQIVLRRNYDFDDDDAQTRYWSTPSTSGVSLEKVPHPDAELEVRRKMLVNRIAYLIQSKTNFYGHRRLWAQIAEDLVDDILADSFFLLR